MAIPDEGRDDVAKSRPKDREGRRGAAGEAGAADSHVGATHCDT